MEQRVFENEISVCVSKGDIFFFFPDWRLLFQNLKHLLKAVTLENLISHRSLLHEGKLVLSGAHTARRIATSFTISVL